MARGEVPPPRGVVAVAASGRALGTARIDLIFTVGIMMCWLGPGAEPGGGGPESPDGPDDGVFAVASPAPPPWGAAAGVLHVTCGAAGRRAVRLPLPLQRRRRA